MKDEKQACFRHDGCRAAGAPVRFQVSLRASEKPASERDGWSIAPVFGGCAICSMEGGMVARLLKMTFAVMKRITATTVATAPTTAGFHQLKSSQCGQCMRVQRCFVRQRGQRILKRKNLFRLVSGLETGGDMVRGEEEEATG